MNIKPKQALLFLIAILIISVSVVLMESNHKDVEISNDAAIINDHISFTLISDAPDGHNYSALLASTNQNSVQFSRDKRVTGGGKIAPSDFKEIWALAIKLAAQGGSYQKIRIKSDEHLLIDIEIKNSNVSIEWSKDAQGGTETPEIKRLRLLLSGLNKW